MNGQRLAGRRSRHRVTLRPAAGHPSDRTVCGTAISRFGYPGDSMNVLLAAHAPLAVDLNAPGGYLNWSIFTISEANLVLIAVMVAIFGIALLAPFPGRRHGADTTAEPGPVAAPEPAAE